MSKFNDKLWEKIDSLYEELKLEDFYNTINEKKYWSDESIIRFLLREEVLFPNSRRYLGLDGSIQSSTIVLFVVLNDVFNYSCSDAEEITTKELPEILELYLSYKFDGIVYWAAKKRKQYPIPPLLKELEEKGLILDF